MSQTVFTNPVVSSGPTRTGTGNGTCSIDRLTHFTITQGYTLTCIAKSPSTLFAVVGDLDGSVGIATVGTQFFDEELKIFLTLQQGSTVFEVGDQFVFEVDNGTDLNQENIDDYDEWPQKNFGAGVLGTAAGDHNLRFSNTSLAAFLYLQDLKFTAAAAGNGGNSITVQFNQYTPAVAASRAIQDLTYTAVTAGTAGNSISIEYVGDGVAGFESVGVVGSAITVHMESTVSTATQIRTAVLASGAAAALVSVAVTGTGSNAQTSAALVNLTGGAGDLGRAGSEIVTVSMNAISIRMESGVSTSTQIKTAFDAAAPATALASCSIIGSSAAQQFYTASTLSLSGGKNKNFALNHDELTDSGAFAEGNANVRIKDLRASGNAEVDGHAHVGGSLSLNDSDATTNRSGPAVSNVQRAVNRLIARGKITLSVASTGFLSWAAPNLTGGNITVTFTDSGNTNVVNMVSGIALTDGQSAYITLSPDVSGETQVPVVASTVPTTQMAFRLATRIGSAVVLFNGSVIYDAEAARLGNPGSATANVVNALIRRDSSGDYAARIATLTKALLATGAANGLDVQAAGDLYIGASVGANTMKLGGASSTVEILGDLTVQGTTTTLNTATLDVEDLNITINKNGNDASSEGAGLTVDRTSTKGSLIYATAAATKFKIGSLGSEIEIADISTSQTFTNKKLSDSTTEIVDVSDSTKKIKFDAAGTTGTKTTLTGSQTADRVLTLPDATDTLVGKATSDSLTNKNLVDTSTFIVDAGDATKKIAFDADGTTGTKTTLIGAQTTDRVLTLPDATDTLTGKATTDALTNKTLAVGSNHITGTLGKIGQFNASTGDLEASGSAVSDLVAKASYRAGSASLSAADTSKAVSFSSTLGTTSYRVIAMLVNTTDASVQYQPITISAKSATGFTASWNGGVDSGNYVLEYVAILDN